MSTLMDLITVPQWVAWRNEMRDGKTTKVPYGASGPAKAKDRSTWITHDQAALVAKTMVNGAGGGVGIELGPCEDAWIIGIDLDTCRDPAAGTAEPWAVAVIERIYSYTEVSPSGFGFKIFACIDPSDAPELRAIMGTEHGRQFKKAGDGDHPPAIELYTSNRYFAVTWEGIEDCPDYLRTVSLDDLRWLIEQAGPAFAGKAKANGKASTDGSRSAAALRKGAALRRQGKTFDEMVGALHADPETADWTKEKGEANNQRELKRIWDKTEPQDNHELILSPSAPLISARQFVERHHQDCGLRTLLHQQDTFYSWKGTNYIEETKEEMRASLYEFLSNARRPIDKGKTVPFDPNKSKVANVVEALAAETQISHSIRYPAWLDAADHPPANELISCQNGLLHLPTRELLEHSPAFFALNCLPFAYDPLAGKPKLWLEFLSQLWPEDQKAVDCLQEQFGLFLTNDTRHQKAFMLVGPKRCGKGTIARILMKLLGQANVCGPTLGSLGQNFGLAPLIGKQVAIISDARIGTKTDVGVIVERILSITGEDSLTVDRKFKEAWTGHMDVRFLMLTNELPKLSDASGAMASRFVVLAIKPSYFGKEDHGLTDRLAQELPGILNWAITGWENLHARGYFQPPASSAEMQQELEDLGSPTGAFVRDRCEVDPKHQVDCALLFNEWLKWCREGNIERPGTTQHFGRNLRALVPGMEIARLRNSTTDQRSRCYRGLRIRT